MRRIAFAIAVALVATGGAHAIERYNSRTLTCGQAHAIVAEQGAVIFRYPSPRKPDLTLYDRFVRHGGFCSLGEVAAPQAIPTKDTASCAVLRCLSRPDDDGFFRHRGGGGNLGNLGGKL